MTHRKKAMERDRQKLMRSRVREVSPEQKNANKTKRKRRKKLQRKQIRKRLTE